MRLLIWVVFIAGIIAAQLVGGANARWIYYAAVLLVITLFRRSLVLALTGLSSRLGLMRGTIERMPSEIHLVAGAAPADAARPILSALAGRGFVDAGSWGILEMPKIHVDLMVHPVEGLLAAVESASPIGAHVNLHTLYSDGQVVSFTNTELPPPKFNRPGVTRTRAPRCDPAALVAQALSQRPKTQFFPVSAADAPRIYERLYADEIRFRKEKGG